MGTAMKGQFQGRPTLLLARLLCSRKTLAFVQYRTRRSTFPFPTTTPSTHQQCQILQSTTPLSRMTFPTYRHHDPLSPAKRVHRLYRGTMTLLALIHCSPCVRQHLEPCLLHLLQFAKPHGQSTPRSTVGNLPRCSSWMKPQLSARVFIRKHRRTHSMITPPRDQVTVEVIRARESAAATPSSMRPNTTPSPTGRRDQGSRHSRP